MRPDPINPGDVIGSKYRVRAVLGRARGLLVEAVHTELEQRVAIRVLSPALLDEKEVGLFRREARLLAKLESEHAARILDVGTLPDGTFYFARQYLEGMDLAAYLAQHGPLPLQDAVLMILQACEAVAETHAHDILLRELEPSHLFVAERIGGSPQLKLVDFGTAKLMLRATAPTAGDEMTATAVCGLSCYASPELIRNTSHLDARADVWSLGAIFYQMLAGHPPFKGDLATLILEITREDPVSMTHWRRDAPAEIDAILRWALAKDVDGRFVNVHAFAHALAPFASAEGQILIQRIGEITAAGRRRRAKGASKRSSAVVPDPRSAATAPPIDQDLRTILMQPLQVGRLLGASSISASPNATEVPRTPRPPESARPDLPSKTARAGGEQATFTRPLSSPARAEQPAGRLRSSTMLGASTVVLLSLIAAMVVVKSGSGRPSPELAGSVAAPAAPPLMSAPPPASPTEPEAPTEGPSTGASARVVIPTTPVAPPPGRKTLVAGPMTAAVPGKDEMGTILAMATGGSCAFFVDGTSKGTTPKLSLQVKAGHHTVMCRSATGAAKSRSIPVEGGKTALAVFKL
jgi:serine/threonine-protein kinase